MLHPEVPGLAGQQRLTFGFEISQALGGGPRIVRFVYGVNLPIGRGLF